MNRKKVVLSVLLILFAVSAVISFIRMPKQKKVAKLKYPPGSVAVAPRAPSATSGTKPSVSPAPAAKTPVQAAQPAPTTAGKATPAPVAKPTATASPSPQASEGRVRLDLLEQQRLFTGFRKNLFKPLFVIEGPAKPPAPPVKPPALIPAPPGPTKPLPSGPPQVVTPPPPTPPPPLQVTREMARFTFLGFMQKDNQKTIFLSKDKDIFVVKKGDKLAGKYEATNITEEALTIRVLSDGGEIVIPLVENRPLKAVKK